MLTEPQASRAAGPERVANLADITVRRPRRAGARKEGDITAALAAMPSSPEIVDFDDVVGAMHRSGGLRDVTPAAAVQSSNILDYWRGLRGAGAMPSRDRLKTSEVAARWPNLVLFRCSGGGSAMHPDTAFSTTLRANRSNDASVLPREPEAMALLSQWMLRVARTVAADGAPARDRSHIDTADGRIEFAMVALPFADGGAADKPDYVLCHVEPVES